MADEPQEDVHWSLRFPAMTVGQVPHGFMTQAGALDAAEPVMWLWIRWPNGVTAIDFGLDQAEMVGKGLIEGAAEMRTRLTLAKLNVVKAPLLGPDGKPVTS